MKQILNGITILIILTACADFKDEEDAVKAELPHTEPNPPPQKEPKKYDFAMMWTACATEIGKAASMVPYDVWKKYSEARLVPVYNIPGDRNSGIKHWDDCEKSLIANGFIHGTTQTTLAIPIPSDPCKLEKLTVRQARERCKWANLCKLIDDEVYSNSVGINGKEKENPDYPIYRDVDSSRLWRAPVSPHWPCYITPDKMQMIKMCTVE